MEGSRREHREAFAGVRNGKEREGFVA